ncbi:winged helix-turn-helix transcriptional regulator [Bradyrhizobium pachyrhizi]|nr:winged helix-turn-helix transcriptional regulator [Bradyrhizobium pachyrhizi]
MIVLMKLRDSPKRLSRLRRDVGGMSRRALSQTLYKLEQEGAIIETRTVTIPPTVKYEITDIGRTLLERISALPATSKGTRRRGP